MIMFRSSQFLKLFNRLQCSSSINLNKISFIVNASLSTVKKNSFNGVET